MVIKWRLVVVSELVARWAGGGLGVVGRVRRGREGAHVVERAQPLHEFDRCKFAPCTMLTHIEGQLLNGSSM